MTVRWLVIAALAAGSWSACLAPGACGAAEVPLDFGRDIRPILSNNCFTCHGPDERRREGGFRLDVRESAWGEADSGSRPIVPGDVAASELYARIVSADDSLRMPPADTGKSLTDEQQESIRRWIAGGAAWKEHWALVPPVQAPLPEVAASPRPRGAIDRFILARLTQERLAPSPPADPAALVRRVTLDLTGLPPTPAEVDAFAADPSDEAYEQLVDRLLDSPHFGEHMARYWLDAARYGDTHGLHLDNYREIWPYRDWVIGAFNRNLPFDRFTIEQLAGDLLPDPGEDQLIATGFNRCHVTTNEGGSIVEEVYVRNVVDQVVTTGGVFLGMTLDCTRCHDHKYDALTMKDFYGLFAFFNSLDGNPLDENIEDPAPVIRVLTAEQKAETAACRDRVGQLQARIAAEVAAYAYAEPEVAGEPAPAEPAEVVWVEDELPPGARAEGGWEFVTDPVFSGQKSSRRSAEGLSQHYFTGAAPPLRVAAGDRLFCYVRLDPANPPEEIMLQWNDGSWEHRAYWGANRIDWGRDGTPSRKRLGELPEAGAWIRLEIPAEEVGLSPGAEINGWAFTQFGGTVWWDRAGIVSTANQRPVYRSLARWLDDQRAAQGSSLPATLQAVARVPAEELNEDQLRSLREHFIEHVCADARPVFEPLHREREAAEKRIAEIEKSAATTMIFREAAAPKPAHILNRGEYDQLGKVVERAVPAALPPLPPEAPRNRLGLAQWLVDRGHPLTARVTVNRFWQQLFGTGIVKTAEDFGSQGEPPSHPELLDWLAVDFRENGWDVQRLLKQLVLSATYRQSSRVSPELAQRDPENRLLARGPRHRLDAEVLRDQALAVSGLLVRELGGPSVKPPQPDGLWEAVGYSGSNTVRFVPDQGHEKVHRRTLYTFIKRTAPPPQLSTFDAPSREACTVRRERTNTPLQALLLMNDPQYLECARGLAERILAELPDEPAARADALFLLCAARHAAEDERAELVSFYRDSRERFCREPEAAARLLAVGEQTPPTGEDAAELAAWTLVANLVLNLDEVVTKN